MKPIQLRSLALLLAALLLGCNSSSKYPTLGSIQRLDPEVGRVLPNTARMEKLAEGFDWSEGPIWVSQGGYLLFSDVPKNVIHKWEEGHPVTDYLKPSGYTGTTPRGGEPGSNGLTLDSEGRLVICQHGDRRIARQEKDGTLTVLADRYEGKRFNSPNDLVYKSNGDLYFTDPPYGLEGKNDDPKKEIPFNGVYRLGKDGKLTLLTRDLAFPNGIAFSPDESTLYVNISDPKNPVIMAYDVQPDGTIARGRVFFNAAHLMGENVKGLPDGLKVDHEGNLFSTGPGGILIIAPTGKHLGTLATGEATANCGWGEDGSTLYITADMYIARIKTKTKGTIPGGKSLWPSM